MAFARIAPTSNVHPFEWFDVGEFFNYNGSIWVKYNSHAAVNILQNTEEDQEFGLDTPCEDIQVELKIV